jgi:type III restriction enzyme
MRGAMTDFLQRITSNLFGSGLNKKIYVIKDECHQATKNLDSLSAMYFDKIINISATPNLKRGQTPDVEITDDEAVNAKLIKRIEIGNEDDTVEEAIIKFEEIKKDYRNLLGVNPCLIIQISNKDKADEEINNTILPILDKAEHQDLKWMIIVDSEKRKGKPDPLLRRTNDSVGKNLPLHRWKDYAKSSLSTIDIIIFKMVISEGWDIPRACMLYQIRDTQSKQLDEQVMGRVRRNPRLLDFETLSDQAGELATTAWIWGIVPDSLRKTRKVYLAGQLNTKTQIQVTTTHLKDLNSNNAFDVKSYLEEQKDVLHHSDLFSLNRKLRGQDDLTKLCYEFSKDSAQWWRFMEHFDEIKSRYESFICDYSRSMEVVADVNGTPIPSSFPLISLYTDNQNYENISDWVWVRRDSSEAFSFDSDAERLWASFLMRISHEGALKAVNEELDPDFIDEDGDHFDRFLWGKLFPFGSEIRFEYYLNGTHYSYPDFVFKDLKGRIHIFEVKSINVKKGSNINSAEYTEKIRALKECYKQCSLLTGQIFYLPLLKDSKWEITRYMKGQEDIISEKGFRKFVLDT